jgi:hypothetical protein
MVYAALAGNSRLPAMRPDGPMAKKISPDKRGLSEGGNAHD